jgi:hypothetical protein
MVDPMFVYLPIAAIVIAITTLRTVRGGNVETGSVHAEIRKLKKRLMGRKS